MAEGEIDRSGALRDEKCHQEFEVVLVDLPNFVSNDSRWGSKTKCQDPTPDCKP